jgi:RNA polymerase sigma factor (sigma-70 family)
VEAFRQLGVPELLRRIRAARSAAEPWRAGGETEALIARSLPRARNVVASFRLPEHPDVGIRPDDRADVVQEALRRAFKMLETFRGSTEGEWFAAVVTCSRFTCRDWLRARLAADRVLAGRLEDAAEGRGRFDPDLARLAELQALDAESAREAADWLQRSLARLPSGRQRRTIELTREGWSTEDIAGALETTVVNVHQLRSRGFAELRKDRP